MKIPIWLMGAAGVALGALLPFSGASASLPTYGTTVPGASAGSFEAGADGSVRYSLPIAVPVGGAGMQPQLAFSYSSNSGNGIVGMGWEVTSPAVISRCGKNVEDDGVTEAVNLSASDRFCLDGQRLETVAGSYGEDGAEYRTQADIFARIISYGGDTTQGPQYFKVWYKSGEIAYFGNTADARREASGATVVESWYLNRIEDRYGNAREYSYEEINASGEHYLSSISYPGGVVEFEYSDSRQAPIQGWTAGHQYQVKRLLINVASYVNGALYRKYFLDYSYDDAHRQERLEAITECAGDASCLQPTTFEWSTAQSDFDREELTSFSNNGVVGTTVLDLNGDGLMDLLLPYSERWWARLNNGSGFDEAINTGVNTDWYQYARVIDFDGDGSQELIIPRSNDMYVMKYEGGTSFSFTKTNASSHGWQNTPKVLDVDGDGLQDLMMAFNYRWQVYYNQKGSFSAPVNTNITHDYSGLTFPFDLEGDGAYEMLAPRGHAWYLIKRMPDGSFSLIHVGAGNAGYDTNPQVADVNGDGLTDLVLAYNHRWYIRINNGKALGSPVLAAPYNHPYPHTQTIDYDGDGRTDLIFPNNGRWYVFRANDAGTFDTIDTGWRSQANHGGRYAIFDIDNDGFTDVFARYSNTWQKLYRGSGDRPGYLTAVTNGFGHRTAFQYGLLSDPTLYTPGAAHSHPLRTVVAPLTVIKAVDTDSKALGKRVSYQYENLVTHSRGRGRLGFARITSVESTGTTTVNEYSHDWQSRQQGLLLRGRKYAGGQLVTEVNNDYRLRYRANSDDRIYYNYLTQTTEDRYELDGGLIYRKVTEQRPDVDRTFSFTGDAAGNIEWMKVTLYGADGSRYFTETDSRYDADNYDQWLLGRITETQVYSGGTGRSSTTRRSAWNYYPDTGYLKEEIIEPDNASLRLTTSYSYNSQGLVATVSRFGASGTARTTSTVYDSLGRYAVEQTNALGHRSRYLYDPLLGLQTRVTDPNGLVTRLEYDSFGRETAVYHPDGRFSHTAIRFPDFQSPSGVQYSGDVTDPANAASFDAVYFIERSDQNGVWQREFYDSSGAVFERQHSDLFGRTVVTTTEYDANGQAARVSEPYFQGAGTVYWTTTAQRDALQRPTRIVNSQGKLTATDYSALERRVTNELGQVKTERFYADGKRRAVEDDDGNRVQYQYDGHGKLTAVTDVTAGITSTISYDQRGQKIAVNDPDKGYWQYFYNAFGEQVAQTDANGSHSCAAYDALGRMVKRIDDYRGSLPTQALADCAGDDSNPQTAQCLYDIATNGIGRLHEVHGAHGYRASYVYDSQSRPVRETQLIDGQSYVTDTSYDSQSRPHKITYPSGLATFNHYNALGFLTEIRKADNREYYWRLLDVDARGNAREERLARGLIRVDKAYSADRGFLESVIASSSGKVGDLQSNYAAYDALGNVDFRGDDLIDYREDFQYDRLNRLQSVDVVTGGQALPRQQMSYHANGNIRSKWNVDGDYQYGGSCDGIFAGPHAVTRAGGQDYCYDRNGNMLSGAGRTIGWTAFGKPASFTTANASVGFQYGPDRRRIRRSQTVNGISAETTYVSQYEKVEKGIGGLSRTVEERHYIGGIAVVTVTDGDLGAARENYMLKDTLGSVIAYVDAAKLAAGEADAVERSAFDPWGQRRQLDGLQPLSVMELVSYQARSSDRGFTGHEHIDAVGLIHMNGRVYDPLLGRFISADPIVQDSGDLQALNRYSYVRNNPVSLVDPNGYSWASKTWKKIAAVAAVIINPSLALTAVATDKGLKEFGRFARKNKYVAEAVQLAGCAAGGQAGCVAATAMVTYGVTDGDLKATARAAAIAYVKGKIKSEVNTRFGEASSSTLARYTLQGVNGGVVSVVSGGSFEAGFVGGLTAAYHNGDTPDWNDSLGENAEMAIVGVLLSGTQSKLSGGSFANGAKSYAMVYAASQASSYYQHAVGRKADHKPGENRASNKYEYHSDTGQQLRKDWSLNVIGLNEDLVGNFTTDFFKQGGPLSRVLNRIPGMNAVAGLHDLWFNGKGALPFNVWTNVGTMLPAASITGGALIGNHTREQMNNPAFYASLTRPQEEDR